MTGREKLCLALDGVDEAEAITYLTRFVAELEG